jgi:hypothetical protein
MNDSEINDIRDPGEFKGFSFSNFKKTEVKKQLMENMAKGKVEPACYWAAELICAGHFIDIWECVLYYAGKYIHLGNPKIVLYLQMRYENFKSIIGNGKFLNELQTRNSVEMRKLFAEIISTVSISNKKNAVETIKINREEEFDMTQMTERLTAPNIHFIEPIFKPKDPKELYIATNEFTYNISNERKNMLAACYWIEWMIEFDAICKKRKEPCYCERRPFVTVENKFSKDIIWILWDALLYYNSLLNNPYIDKLMNGLLTLFSIKYTTASCKKRRYLLYFAVELLTEPVPTNIELTANKQTIQNVIEKINNVYKQIKKNERSPGTDYLFNNLDKQNTFNQSMQKMELMNMMDFIKDK